MIAIGSDHGRVELKEYRVSVLRARGLDIGHFGAA